MNNNLNFSKNVFGGNANTKISGGPIINSYSQDGGRRSLEEVRQDQLNADRGINPDAGKEFQVNINQGAYQKPLDSGAMTGAFITPNNQTSMQNNNPMPATTTDAQMDATRARMQAMQGLNKRGF
jgi:hypothetical protein